MKNFFIETYGCTSNKFDSGVMTGLLVQGGYNFVNDEKKADCIIINSCAVKAKTEDKIIWRIRELNKLGKKLIIAGCLNKVNLKRIKNTVKDASFIDTNSVDRILEVVRRIEQNENNIELFSEKTLEKIKLPSISFNRAISIIQISEGCCSNCAFCATKLSRGDVKSCCPESIKENIVQGIKEGFKEFQLTSQDISAYGKDIGIGLPDLLEEICNIDGNFKIRIGMMNPLHFLKKKKELERLIEVYKNDKIFKFLHLCVQSGSDRILKLMNRGYRVKDFKNIIRKFRQEIPDLTIWTDIIVGFPGETEEDFEKTIKLIKEEGFDYVNVSAYSVRNKTKARLMKQITSEVKKQRSKRLSEYVCKAMKEQNKKWNGWKGSVLIDEYKESKDNFIGRNYTYKPIALRGDARLGDIVNVEIVDAKKTCLIGKII